MKALDFFEGHAYNMHRAKTMVKVRVEGITIRSAEYERIIPSEYLKRLKGCVQSHNKELFSHLVHTRGTLKWLILEFQREYRNRVVLPSAPFSIHWESGLNEEEVIVYIRFNYRMKTDAEVAEEVGLLEAFV